MTDIVWRGAPVRVHVVFVDGTGRKRVRFAVRIPEEEPETFCEPLVDAKFQLRNLDDVAVVVEEQSRAIPDQRAISADHAGIDIAASWETQTKHVDVIHRNREVVPKLPLHADASLLRVRILRGSARQ